MNGGTIEDAANILGDSPEVIRRYYAKWSRAYQTRTVELLERIAAGQAQFRMQVRIPSDADQRSEVMSIVVPS